MIVLCIITLFVGALAGICSGLFGLGGGIIVVPSLLFLFRWIGFSSVELMHLAIGTSVTATTFSTCMSVIKHAGRGGIVKRTAIILAPTVAVAALVGAFVGNSLPDKILRYIFGAILSLLGLWYLFERKKTAPEDDPHHSIFFLLLGGVAIGFVSSLLGVGGGFFVVPLLLAMHTPFKQAAGTASVSSFCITVMTAFSYLFYGLNVEIPIPYTFSYIFWPAAIGVAIGAIATAPLGVKIAHVAPVHIIKRIFAVLIIAAGISMIF